MDLKGNHVNIRASYISVTDKAPSTLQGSFYTETPCHSTNMARGLKILFLRLPALSTLSSPLITDISI